MEPLELVNHLASALDDKQGRDIVIIDVENLVGYTAYFVIASGRSERQVQALIQSVRTSMKTKFDLLPIGVEGAQGSRWALADFGDAVVHVFREDERNFYDLEGLWSDAPRVEFTPPDQADATT
jgi:ribosome-associated protein